MSDPVGDARSRSRAKQGDYCCYCTDSITLTFGIRSNNLYVWAGNEGPILLFWNEPIANMEHNQKTWMPGSCSYAIRSFMHCSKRPIILQDCPCVQPSMTPYTFVC